MAEGAKRSGKGHPKHMVSRHAPPVKATGKGRKFTETPPDKGMSSDKPTKRKRAQADWK